jgi:hypothetical protein
VNRNCAFVNFTNIANAIKAIDGVKSKPEYANLRIAHGKDRCANPPRSGPQGGSGVRRMTSGAHGQGNGSMNGHGHGAGGGGEDGEMQYLNGEEDEGVLDVIAELGDGDATGAGVGVGEVQEMHVDGKEPAATVVPIITTVAA